MPKSVVAAGLLALGIGIGVALATTAPEPAQLQTIEWLEHPRTLDSFHLQAVNETFDNQSLSGHWSVLLFGFLSCPDICPTSLSELAALAEGLQAAALDQHLRFAFISVDPGRDSVAAVHEYAQFFSPAVLGATGNNEQLARLARSLGMAFNIVPDDEGYSVAHGVTFSIIDPSGQFRGRFRPGFPPSPLIQNLIAKITAES